MQTFHRSIFFTKAPLSGYYKYKEIFQIFPADLDGMPKTKFQRHFPNIIEYWTSPEDVVSFPFDEEEDADGTLNKMFSGAATTIKKESKILALLSAFTNNIFFRYTDFTGSWGIPMVNEDPGEEANSWSSQWSLGLFMFPGLPEQLKITSFSKPTIQEINIVDFPEYYMNNPHLDADWEERIAFPAIMHQLLDAYFALSAEKRKIVDTAISYTVSAVELSNSRKTLSLLASFTSMETMVNLEYEGVKAERCEVCGQQKFSIARKFREFLLKYLGNSENNKKKFNKYYNLRSKIVHTGQQLQTEFLFSEVEKETRSSELLTRVEILQLGKLAIISWLLSQTGASLGAAVTRD